MANSSKHILASAQIAALALMTVGCSATRNFDTKAAGTEPNKMLAGTAVDKNRCDSGKAVQSPFVVEWDATDLSTFEAKASRDVVFVRYQGCELELLYACSDNSVPGIYGKYQEPTFTSGTVEGFTMKNEDELYAKLPLGAASFGASVKVGEALELQYFVSGAVNATRNSVDRGTLAANPRCEGATHFVSAYNLGAFQLLAHKGAAGSAHVGFKNAGGGAKTSQESSNLKEGGSLQSCETQAQNRCRVPIRLVLQPIEEQVADLDAGIQPAAPAPPPNAGKDWNATPQGRAMALRRSAMDKERTGDGPGCIADLDRAKKLEPNRKDKQDLYLRPNCLMLAGKCDKGKKLMADYLKGLDAKHKRTDSEIAKMVDAGARIKCPAAKQKSLAGKVTNMHTRVAQAQERRDAQGCVNAAKQAEKLYRKLPKKASLQDRQSVGGIVQRASMCLAVAERCTLAKKWYFKAYDLMFTGTMSADEIKSAAAQTFVHIPQCKGK